MLTILSRTLAFFFVLSLLALSTPCTFLEQKELGHHPKYHHHHGSSKPEGLDSKGGIATFFYQDGVAGACGKVHTDRDHVVALHTSVFEKGRHCGKTIVITNKKTRATFTGTVADECPSCHGPGSIDLSMALFKKFAKENDGTFPGMGYYSAC